MVAADQRWAVLLLACVSLTGIWRLWRKTRFLREALRRERQRSIERCNEIQRQLLTTFFDAGVPTLQSLADDTETDFTLKPSGGS